MKKILMVFVAIAMIFTAAQVMAGLTPESVDGIKVVDADWVKANISKVTVFDARKKGEYVESHIAGSVSVPYKEKSEKNLEFDETKDKWKMGKYPSEKDAMIVVYCNGVKCWKSLKSVIRLRNAGYTNLYWLRDGFPGWQEKGYAVE